MQNNYQMVFDWMSKFGQETPRELVMPSLDTRKLRASLIFEEALECVAALGFCVKATRRGYENTYVFLSSPLTDYSFVDESDPNMEGILDGLVDLDWMNKGTLIAMGASEELLRELEEEIYRSNSSKLWTRDEIAKEFGPLSGSEGSNIKGDTYKLIEQSIYSYEDHCYLVKSHLGKVLKSPSYSPANLVPIIQKYAKNSSSNNLESTKS